MLPGSSYGTKTNRRVLVFLVRSIGPINLSNTG